MNEKVIEQVISEYAIEVANLKIKVATLQIELAKLTETEENEEEK